MQPWGRQLSIGYAVLSIADKVFWDDTAATHLVGLPTGNIYTINDNSIVRNGNTELNYSNVELLNLKTGPGNDDVTADMTAGPLPHIVQVGNYLHMRLDDLKRHYSFIKEVRGRGLMIGMELNIPGKQLVLDAMEQGLLLNCTHDTVLRFLPPYILTEQDVDRAMAALTKVFKRAQPPQKEA